MSKDQRDKRVQLGAGLAATSQQRRAVWRQMHWHTRNVHDVWHSTDNHTMNHGRSIYFAQRAKNTTESGGRTAAAIVEPAVKYTADGEGPRHESTAALGSRNPTARWCSNPACSGHCEERREANTRKQQG